ncbi:MAG: ABC transporter permease [Clostridia bacterium]|nr:ABC transporter permease [Clostridia bacterium]
MTVTFLISAIAIGTVLLFGCVGETITEKAGHLNLGIPGIMCTGTVGGCFFVSLYMNSLEIADNASWIMLILSSLLGAFLFASLTGAIYAVMTITFNCNQNITGLAITIFGNGLTQFLMHSYVDKSNFSIAGKIISKSLPFAENSDGIIKVLFGHGFYVYLAIIIALVTTLIFNRTKVGLNLRAIGENTATADAMGVNITLYKYIAILVGSGIAGFGGVFYIMDYVKGSWENASTIEAFGWLSIALVIFTLWKPNISIIGSYLFGALYIAAFVFGNISFSGREILKLLPYVITIIVLIITSMMNKKENQPPASLGLSYFREDR